MALWPEEIDTPYNGLLQGDWQIQIYSSQIEGDWLHDALVKTNGEI